MLSGKSRNKTSRRGVLDEYKRLYDGEGKEISVIGKWGGKEQEQEKGKIEG